MKGYRRWVRSGWNQLDAFAIGLFFVAFCLRYNYRLAGHVLYAFDIMLWIFRVLDTFKINKSLGPTVVTISRMVRSFFTDEFVSVKQIGRTTIYWFCLKL